MDEVRAIVNATDNEYYKAIFKLLTNTGMRISELLKLRKSDIRIVKDTAKLRIHGKDNKERIVMIKPTSYARPYKQEYSIGKYQREPYEKP
nr:tyrosine-type recombinase/integrase [Thermotoga sp.]